MPHYLGPNRKVRMVTRKVFENFNRCGDDRAWMAAITDQNNDSWREFCVSKKHNDPEDEYLRQWLLKNGATEKDEYVFVAICW